VAASVAPVVSNLRVPGADWDIYWKSREIGRCGVGRGSWDAAALAARAAEEAAAASAARAAEEAAAALAARAAEEVAAASATHAAKEAAAALAARAKL
jgi:hypothetical protein